MVYLDPIGTGRSSLLPGGEYFMPTYAHYFEAVLDHIGEPRPIILGHSHGGMVALELAMRDPHRLGGLIAYDTAPVYNDALWEEAGRQMSAYADRWPHRPETAVAVRAWNERHEVRTDAASARQWLADVTPAYFADYHRVADGSFRLDLTWDPNRRNGVWYGAWRSRRHRHADVDHLRCIRLRLSTKVVRADTRRDSRIRPRRATRQRPLRLPGTARRVRGRRARVRRRARATLAGHSHSVADRQVFETTDEDGRG